MKSNWEKSLKFVLDHEGGYVFDPKDPGGETKYGISKRAFPNQNIKDLTIEQAGEIYKVWYWNNCNCDELEWPFDMIVFDTAVNMGQKRAAILYQENKIWQDYLFSRLYFYSKTLSKKNDRFLEGWVNRVIDLYREIRKYS